MHFVYWHPTSVVAAVTRNVYDSGASGTLLDLTGKVKFGTADETKGLGTGKNDYAVQLDAYQNAGNATLLGTVGYKGWATLPGLRSTMCGTVRWVFPAKSAPKPVPA